MPRRTKSLTIIEEFAPDPARCAQALLRLLMWEPPPPTPLRPPKTWHVAKHRRRSRPTRSPLHERTERPPTAGPVPWRQDL